MIPNVSRLTSRSRRAAISLAALVGAASLLTLSAVHAEVPTVQPNDVFSIGLIAYNTATPIASTNDYYSAIASSSGTLPVQSTFGMTTFGQGLDGQLLTVNSGQTTLNGTTTYTITISVPNNFVPADQDMLPDGKVVNALDFTLGIVGGSGGTDTLDFTSSIMGATFSGSGIYNGGMFSLADRQNPVFSNNGTSLSNQEFVYQLDTNGNPSSISPDGVRSFTFTISVPEPSTYAMLALGTAGLFMVVVRRRRNRV